MIKNWTEYFSESKISSSDGTNPIYRLDKTEEDIYNYALKLIDDKINDILINVHQKFNTVSGDITPEQESKLNELQKKLAKLISKQVCQNLGEDFSKVKSSNIDIEALKNLSDERRYLKEGDDVILIYFDGGYSIYRCKLKIISREPFKLGWKEDDYTAMVAGRRGNPKTYKLDDAYKAVSVETYNDFCDPNKRFD
jgi:hypothetical protein